MADNKRQHYVPKHTLRRFASDPHRKKPRQINLLNIARAKIIRNASLADQCYRDYFYGKNTAIEKALSQIEGHFSALTRRMIETLSIDERDGWLLVQMIILQKSRTLRAEEELNEITNKLAKLFMYNRVSEDDLRRVKIKIKNAAHHNVGQALMLSPLILDLKRFLIVNQTDIPFVIADNPVISTNWFGRIRHPGRATGLARSGLQMLLPLSPCCALLMHDSNVYTTESRRNIISISHRDEITALNKLQWLNAYKNIYFPPNLKEDSLNAMMNVARPLGDLFNFRRMEMITEGTFRATDKDEFSPPPEEATSELISMSSRVLPQDVRLRAIHLRNRPIFHDDGSLASPQRDPAWEDIVSEFAREARTGLTSLSSLWDFVDKHPLASSIGPWLRRATRRSSRGRQ